MIVLKKAFRTPLFAVVALTVAAVLVFQAPAAAATGYTFSSLEGNNYIIRYCSAYTDMTGLVTDHYTDSNNIDRYIMKFHAELPLSMVFDTNMSTYKNGRITWYLNYTKTVQPTAGLSSYNIYMDSDNDESLMNCITSVNNSRIYFSTFLNNVHWDGASGTGNTWTKSMGNLCIDFIYLCTDPTTKLTLTFSGVEQYNNISSSQTSADHTIYDQVKQAINESTDIDSIISYLISANTLLAQSYTSSLHIEDFIEDIDINLLPSVLTKLTNMYNELSTIDASLDNIEYYTILNNGVLNSIYSCTYGIRDYIIMLYEMQSSIAAENAAQQSAAESNVAEASGALDNAGNEMSEMASEMEISKPDVTDIVNAADQYMNQASVESQQHTFAWLNKPLIILILSLVFALAIISYALYGGQ